jgi:acyl-CoA reductase-like NAD-dependent aldehyde dehydrogenase
MNAAGLTATLAGVVAGLKHPAPHKQLVAGGKISQNEIDATIENLEAALRTLRKTPHHAIDKLVAEYDAQLTQHVDRFNREWTRDSNAAFHDAQILVGYIATIMTKSGVRE